MPNLVTLEGVNDAVYVLKERKKERKNHARLITTLLVLLKWMTANSFSRSYAFQQRKPVPVPLCL